MIAPETLLRMSPLDALRAQIGERLIAPLKSEHLLIGTPKSLGGVKTSVEVQLDKAKTPVDLWDRVGKFTFFYDRLDVGEFTAGIDMSIPSSLPVDAKSLMIGILDRYEIPVVATDFSDSIYTELGNAAIQANPESYRWVGNAVVNVSMKAIEIQTLILVNRLTLPFTADFMSTSVKAKLVTFLNSANSSALPIPITTAMFDLSLPVENGPVDGGSNTKVTLTFKGQPYTGEFDVVYSRRGFEKTFRWPIEIGGPQITTTTTFALALSAQMGCTILTSDIKAEPVGDLVIGQSAKVAVNFNSKSLAYMGTVMVNYTRTQ